MKNQLKNYRLVARMQGNELILSSEVRDHLARLYDRRVERLSMEEHRVERRALLASHELERKGDFLWATGAKHAAAKAYLEALKMAEGIGSAHDRTRREPAMTLGERRRILGAKIERLLGSDPRLRELIHRPL